LKLADLQNVTSPFLDQNWVAGQQNEYTTVQSIFAPIKDVLGRAEWSRDQIDHVLLVGGSAQYYGNLKAIKEFIPNAQTYLTFENAQDFQRCVGRGAAYQALLLTAYGKSPLEATLAGELKLLAVKNGQNVYEQVVPTGVTLPFPAEGEWHIRTGFSLGTGSQEDQVPIFFSLKFDEKELVTAESLINPPSKTGDSIVLKIRIDANQHIEFAADVATEIPQSIPPTEIDNPFSVVANPNADRDRILEIEQKVHEVSGPEQRAYLIELVQLHRRIGEFEKARYYLEGLLAHPGQSDSQKTEVLHWLGLICEQLHDTDAQIGYYKKALEIKFVSGIAFNLALSMLNQKEYEAAIDFVQMIFDSPNSNGTTFALQSYILREMGKDEEAKNAASECVESYSADTLSNESDYTLGWLRRSATLLNYNELVSKIDLILNGRNNSSDGDSAKKESSPNFLPRLDA
jgi:tetratricopeptide (TPR) repeat protein